MNDNMIMEKNTTPILETVDLNKTFHMKGAADVHAVNNVSIKVGRGECVGIVGESGCGKSTFAKLVSRLEDSDSGKILLNGEDIAAKKGAELRKIYKDMKMVFQMPRSSFDPRLTLGDSIREAMLGQGYPRKMAQERCMDLLKMVGLDERLANAYPRDASGGECQRAAIARAISTNPSLLICDEATSALDVSVQAQIMELLESLKEKQDISFLFISHDIALVSSFCSSTYVMYKGQVVEQGDTQKVIHEPTEEYTKRLMASVLRI